MRGTLYFLHMLLMVVVGLIMFMLWIGGVGGIIGIGFDSPSNTVKIAVLIYALLFTSAFVAGVKQLFLDCYIALIGFVAITILSTRIDNDTLILILTALLTIVTWGWIVFDLFNKRAKTAS